jgi:hypothetical protein
MQQMMTECRVYERHACQVPTACQPAAANEMRWDATITDISLSGVRIRLRRRFEPRSALAIELPGGDDQDAATVYVKVIRVVSEGDGSYSLGCRFMSELSQDELDRLLAIGCDDADAARGAPGPRRAVVTNLHLWIDAGPGRFVRCRVKRFHVAGAWPLVPGSVLNLRGVAADGSRLEHGFEVVDCNKEAEGWTVRVQPVDPEAVPAWVVR